jgi:hypothetical protein
VLHKSGQIGDGQVRRASGFLVGALLVALCAAAAVLGAAQVERANGMPEFTDAARAEAIWRLSPPMEPDRFAEFRDWYNQEMRSLRTEKWELHERGRSLIALAATGLVAILRFRLWDARNLLRVKTPRTGRRVLLLLAVAQGGMLPVYWCSLAEEYDRRMFPHWADIIMIPMASATMVIAVILPTLAAVVWFTALRGARLPTSLWLWDGARPARSLFWTAAYGALSLFALWMLEKALMYGPHLWVPLHALLFYVFLSARAAAISRPVAPRRGEVAGQAPASAGGP